MVFVDDLRTVINGNDGPLPRKRCKRINSRLSQRPSTHTIPQSITRPRRLIVSRVGNTCVYLGWFIADLFKVIQTFKKSVQQIRTRMPSYFRCKTSRSFSQAFNYSWKNYLVKRKTVLTTIMGGKWNFAIQESSVKWAIQRRKEWHFSIANQLQLRIKDICL